MKIFKVATLVITVFFIGAFLYLNQSSGGMVGFSVKRMLFDNVGSPTQVEINGVSLYYETYGSRDAGSPVLILHGDFAYIETMHNQIRELSESHFVISPDSRAHGRSSDDNDIALSYSLMADDMVALLNALDIEKVSVFGWSGGGNVGMDMAIRYPTRIDRLVTYGSNFNPNGVDQELIAKITPDSPFLSSIRSSYGNLAPDPDHWPAFVQKMKLMWQTYPKYTSEDLAKINVPTLIMAGEFDLIPTAHTEEMADNIPNAELIIVKDQDHYAPLMASSTVTPQIVKFLE